MINNKMFPKEILSIADGIKKENGELFLVGGSLRDIFLGRKPIEYDFEIYANFEKKKEYELLIENEKEAYTIEFINKIKLVLKEFGDIDEKGKSFGVIKMSNKPYDFSFPRKENKAGITRKDYEISLNPFLDYKEAQRRRDLTINTLMYSFDRQILIDNFNGLKDIEEKVIRYVDPLTFSEDPLRAYRIGQFVSRLGFAVDDKTLNLCKEMDLSTLSLERIHWEMEKLFSGKDILLGLNFLNEAQVFLKRHPEFEELYNYNNEKKKYINKIKDFFNKEMKMVEKMIFIFILFSDEKNNVEYLEKTKRILNTFTTNKKDIDGAVLTMYSLNVLIEYILEKIDYEDVIFKLWNKKNPNLILYIKFWFEFNNNKYLNKKNKIEEVFNVINNFKPLITGKDLLEIGIKESEEFKTILDKCIKIQIKGFNKDQIIKKIKGETKI